MSRWNLFRRDAKRRQSGTRRHEARTAEPLFDALEQRQLMFTGPFLTSLPTTGQMENVVDTVVRMQTNFGNIDIELYDTINPNTVTNFLSYIKGGDWEETFFHRMVKKTQPNGIGIIQGGGFRFDDIAGKTNVTQKAAINNEFNRPNAAGTIAMAKTSLGPNTATSQWYFNVENNPVLDDPLNNGGYTVFGKIIQGMNVLQSIYAVNTLNLNSQLGENPIFGPFTDVPVTAGYNPGAGPKEATLVYLRDIEIIKSFGNVPFYSQANYYSEGFRGATTAGRVDLLNLHPNLANNFQIIARYENGLRDQVVWTGQIAANRRQTIELYDSAKPGLNLVRSNAPFALEIRTTQPMAATLNHSDTGFAISEGFAAPGNLPDGWMTNWNFGEARVGPGIQNFVTTFNPTAETIQVFVEVVIRGQANGKVYGLTIEPGRRSGLAVHNLGLAANTYSYRLASLKPFVAGLTQYEFSNVSEGSTSQGVFLGGRSEGIVPAARTNTAGTSSLQIMYTPGPAAAILLFDFFFTNGTSKTSSPLILSPTARRATFDLAAPSLALPKDQFYTIRYRIQGGAQIPVAVNYSASFLGDSMSTSAIIGSSQRLYFADAYLDPSKPAGQYAEIFSLFNPYSNASTTFTYKAYAHFSDGVVYEFAAGALGANRRVDLQPQYVNAIVNKAKSAPAFRSFSVSIWTNQVTNGTPVTGAGVAQHTRIDLTGTQGGKLSTTNASLNQFFPLWLMDNAAFN